MHFKCLSKKNILCNETCEYEKIQETLNKTKLTQTQRQIIESFFKNKIQNYHKNLNPIIDNIQNNEDKSLIYKGLIEIAYNLRNALFHSNVDISQEKVKRAYKIAYMLLRDIIYQLPI